MDAIQTVVVVLVGEAEQETSAAVVVTRPIVLPTARETREGALAVLAAGVVAVRAIHARVAHAAGQDAATPASDKHRQRGPLFGSVARLSCPM
jgi:hypothetical protein